MRALIIRSICSGNPLTALEKRGSLCVSSCSKIYGDDILLDLEGF